MASLLMLISILTPILVAFTSMLKNYIPMKFHPLIPVIVGLVLAPISGTFVAGLSIIQLIWAGLLAGLSAGGFYSVQNIRNK